MGLSLIAMIGLGLLGWLHWSPQPFDRRTSDALGGPEDQGARTRRNEQLARARRLLDQADHAGAAAALDRALEANPWDAEALALQVRAFRAQRQYAAARTAALRILERFPQSPLAHVLLGSIALQEGDAASARRGLERAIALDTSSALALAQLAELDLMAGMVPDARARAERALSLEPGNTTALRVLSRVSGSVPELLSIFGRLMEASGDELARSWLQVLRSGRAQRVNEIMGLKAEVAIPWEVNPDGRVFVRAEVSGMKGLRMLLDTGASGLVLSEAVARRLGHRLREFAESTGVGGTRSHAHPIVVERIALGGVQARNLMATASVLPEGMSGILNPLALAPAGSRVQVELRPSRRALVFAPEREPSGRGSSTAERWVTVPFLADGHHVIFRVVLAGRPAMALLDTGAAVDLVDRSMLARLPPTRLHAPLDPGEALVGFGGRVDDAEVVADVGLRVAGRDFITRRLFVMDLNVEPFRFQVDLDAVVGIERLLAFDLRIDPGRGLLSFKPLESSGSTGTGGPIARRER